MAEVIPWYPPDDTCRLIRRPPRAPYVSGMEILDVAREPRVNAPVALADPPAPAVAAFGLVLLHVAFFAAGSVLLIIGFAASGAQRLAAVLRSLGRR